MTFEIVTRAALVQHTVSSGQRTKVGMTFQITIDMPSPEVSKWVDPENRKLICPRPELHERMPRTMQFQESSIEIYFFVPE